MVSQRLLSSCFGLYLAALGTQAWAQNVTPLNDFRSGPGNGVYSYPSSTPETVLDLMNARRPRAPATAQGELLLPANAAADTKLPAVVLVHGSGGVYQEEVSYWARLLNEQGIVALVIDVFGPRGVKSTGEDQSQVPFAADTADAFAALGMLASHPHIDPTRIAVMGFSRGGITAVRSAFSAMSNCARGVCPCPSRIRWRSNAARVCTTCARAAARLACAERSAFTSFSGSIFARTCPAATRSPTFTGRSVIRPAIRNANDVSSCA